MITIRRVIAGVSVAITLAASTGTALAGTFDITANGTMVLNPPPAHRAVAGHRRGEALAPIMVRVTSVKGGFNWGDAVIGLVAGVAIATLTMGSGLAVVQRRQNHMGYV